MFHTNERHERTLVAASSLADTRTRRRIALAGAWLALGAAVLAPAATAADGAQVVTGTVASAITVTHTAVGLSEMSHGSTTPASGSGTVTVVSTDCYSVAISDPANGGYLKSAANNAFGTRLQWKLGTGSFTDLLPTPANLATHQPVTLGKTYEVDYQQLLGEQNVPAGVYSTSVTFTAASSSC